MTVSSGQLVSIFRRWLETSETYAFLARFVHAKSRSEESAGIIRADDPEDLCHEFLLFLVDSYLDAAKLSPEQILLIRSAQYRRVLELAWGRFIWHRREIARSKNHNPRGYLYRRLREILQHNPGRFVVIRNRRDYLYYYPTRSVAEHVRPNIGSEEEHSTGYAQFLPPPPATGQTAEKYLFSEKWLLGTADFFWHQAMQDETEPLALPIRALCRYLADHHPWLNKPQRQEGTEWDCVDQLVDERETPEEHLQRINGLQSVVSLAAQLIATWPAEQRQVFVLRLADPPVQYEAIAERLGLANHNRAYALQQKALHSLQRFIGNWPGVPLSELPEEVALSFIEEMKRLCKNSLFCP